MCRSTSACFQVLGLSPRYYSAKPEENIPRNSFWKWESEGKENAGLNMLCIYFVLVLFCVWSLVEEWLSRSLSVCVPVSCKGQGPCLCRFPDRCPLLQTSSNTGLSCRIHTAAAAADIVGTTVIHQFAIYSTVSVHLQNFTGHTTYHNLNKSLSSCMSDQGWPWLKKTRYEFFHILQQQEYFGPYDHYLYLPVWILDSVCIFLGHASWSVSGIVKGRWRRGW